MWNHRSGLRGYNPPSSTCWAVTTAGPEALPPPQLLRPLPQPEGARAGLQPLLQPRPLLRTSVGCQTHQATGMPCASGRSHSASLSPDSYSSQSVSVQLQRALLFAVPGGLRAAWGQHPPPCSAGSWGLTGFVAGRWSPKTIPLYRRSHQIASQYVLSPLCPIFIVLSGHRDQEFAEGLRSSL